MHGVKETYKVKKLEGNKAMKLSSHYAFKRDHPIEDFRELSKDVLVYTQGLPLALKVLGSLFEGIFLNLSHLEEKLEFTTQAFSSSNIYNLKSLETFDVSVARLCELKWLKELYGILVAPLEPRFPIYSFPYLDPRSSGWVSASQLLFPSQFLALCCLSSNYSKGGLELDHLWLLCVPFPLLSILMKGEWQQYNNDPIHLSPNSTLLLEEIHRGIPGGNGWSYDGS
ncbi:hypothetical protein AAG906_013787 [Vitis piasezkii]